MINKHIEVYACSFKAYTKQKSAYITDVVIVHSEPDRHRLQLTPAEKRSK